MKRKILTFIQKATKIVDRTQDEILKDRKQKRNEMVDKLRRKSKL